MSARITEVLKTPRRRRKQLESDPNLTAVELAFPGPRRHPLEEDEAEARAGARCLVIAPQWIGDAVMTEPLLRNLAASGQVLTVAALPSVADVYRAMPQVSNLIELTFARGGLQFNARRALALQLRDQFDVAYVLPNSFKSAVLPWLAQTPRRVGYVGESRYGVLTERLPNPKNKPPMVAFYLALAGATALPTDQPKLTVTAEAVDASLQELGLQRGQFSILAPGADFGSAKRWPAERFVSLALLISGPVVLLGSLKDAALCSQIADAINAQHPGCGINLASKTSLAQAIHAVAATKSIATNDSGLMHVAAALGVPQVAIFGSSSPLHTPPLNRRAAVLWLKADPSYQPPLDCAPCFQRVCPLPLDGGHMRCLSDISAERAYQALADVSG
jgi:heptosyltransferase II